MPVVMRKPSRVFLMCFNRVIDRTIPARNLSMVYITAGTLRARCTTTDDWVAKELPSLIKTLVARVA